MKPCFTEEKRPYFFTSFFALFFALASQVAFGQAVDCSDSDNCGDAYCNFAANIEKGCNCFDGQDNDGDGEIDKADLGCAPYYGLTFVGEGSDCSILPPGINDPFDLVDDPVKSGQNTSDTQSKVSVGDVDGDGTPDAVVTSKWGGFIKVVNTLDGTEKSKWDLTSDVGNTFNNQPNSGVCKVSKLKFEHENLIADIDGNGTAEIFGVVSNRGGSPTTPPTCFYFVAFTYADDVLTPLYQAVNIGTDRPGTFGIADMDGDGKAELYMRDRIYAAETGKLLATSTGTNSSAGWDTNINAGPVAVDITGNDGGVMELVCGTKIFTIPNLSANRSPATPATLPLLHDMNTLPAAAANKCFVKLANDIEEYGVDTHNMCSVADMDRDGNIDVVISGALNSNGGRTAVFYWNVSKQTVDYALTPSSADMGWGPGDTYYDNYLTGWIWGTGRVNLGDIDGDGDMDMNFIAGSHLMALTLDAAGTGLENLWTQNLTPVAGSPVPEIGFRQIEDSRSGVITTSVYDFNNDGDPELVYRDSYKLVVTDGATGVQDLLVRECKSHTYTEGPVVADVNGDGATDICVACFRGPGVFKPDGKINDQNLGEFRLYYSEGNEWLPTRKVWNQPGYFVVNINDDLTLPFPQYDQTTVFGLEDCPNGTPGPQTPLNGFLNQVPNLSANGCPVFPAPDLAYHGDDPDNPGVDENGDGVYTPAVEVIPPICGDLTFQTRFHILNDGDLPITADIPVSFFKANPTSDTIELEDLLYSTTINVSNLAVDGTLTTAFESFDGTGGTFTMFIVLNNDGTILPIDTTASSPTECRIANNIYSLQVVPDPFTTKIEKLQDNYKCEDTAPDNGALQVHVFKNGIEQPYDEYSFQWFAGDSASHVPIAGATDYNIFGLPEGDYTVQVTNIAKGCQGSFVDTLIVRTGVDPAVTFVKLSDQENCNPPDGALEATIAQGNAGFTFEWFDLALTPLGITGSTATNLKAGSYVLRVSKDGCTKEVATPTILDPQVPDASADVVQHVIDCINPNSGAVTADAVLGGITQDPAGYTFEWYEYDSVTNIQGTILPAAHGVGPVRTGLPAGAYQVVITDNATKCESLQQPFVSVVSQTVVPVAAIAEIAPQTSCDPAQPNGILTASASGLGLTSPNDFTFEWFVGDNTLAANKIPNASSPSTLSGAKGETVNQVVGGGVFYTVKVTTANNCSDTEKIIITENVEIPVITLTSTPNSICDPTIATSPFSGSVTATVTFDGAAVTLPDPNYTFTWHDGPLSSDPVLPVADVQAASQTGLEHGYYTVSVERTDLHCTAVPDSEEVLNITVLPTIVSDSIPSTNCVVTYNGNNISNGQASVLTIDGAAPSADYAFLWSDNASPTDVDGLTTSTITAIQGGFDYTVEVTNLLNGCKSTDLVSLPDKSVVPVVTLAVEQSNSICDATLTDPPVNYNGRIAVSFTTPSGNAADYKYTWRNVTDNAGLGDTPPNNNGQGVTLATQFGGLNGNKDYSVIAENTVLGCTSGAAQIYVPNTLVLPKIKTDSIASTNCVVNYGGNLIANGQARVLTVDGVAANPAIHKFLWSDNGSTTDADGRTTSTITQIQGGFIYTVQVTNSLTGCRNTDPVPLSNASVVPVVSLAVEQNNTICDASLTNPPVQFNGRIAASFITPSGNATDYKYTWRNVTNNLPLGDTPPVNGGPGVTLITQFGGLEGNKDYSVIAENTALGCTSGAAQVYLPNSVALPKIKTDSIASTNCVLNYGGNMIANGQAFVLTVDGAAPNPAIHNFLWSDNASTTDADGRTTSTITQIQGGFIYTVQVTNLLTGCRNTDPVPLSDASVVPVVTLNVEQNNTICDASLTDPPIDFNGRIAASFTTPSGNATDYKYTWRNVTNNLPLGDTPPVNGGPGVTLITQFGGLEGNKDYSVIAENTVLGCTSGAAQIYLPNSFVLPVIETDSIASTNCVLNYNGNMIANGEAFVLTVDGVAPNPAIHDFLWSDNGSTTDADGRTTSTITALQGGFIYTVQVTNLLTGCRNTDPVPLADASVIPAIDVTVLQENTICDVTLGFNGQLTTSFLTPSGDPTLYKYTWRNVTGNLAAGVTDAGNVFAGPPALLLNQQGGLNGGLTYGVIAEETDLGCTSGEATVFLPNNFALPVIKTDSIASTNCVVEYPAPGNVISNGSAFVSLVDGKVPGAAGAVTGTDYSYNWIGTSVAPAPLVNGLNTVTISNIQGGYIYTVQVKNLHTGCTNTDPVALPDKSVVPSVDVTVLQENTICDVTLGFNGQLTTSFLTPSGTAALYKYTWRNVTDAQPAGVTDAGNVFAGLLLNQQGGLNGGKTYGVIAEETALGCTSGEATVFLPNNFALPVIKTDSVASTNCVIEYPAPGNVISNGSAFVSLVDGKVPGAAGAVTGTDYSYNWIGTSVAPAPLVNGLTTVSIANIQGGYVYTVEVTNLLTGCTNTDPVALPDKSVVPVVDVTVLQENTICDVTLGFNGQLTSGFITPVGDPNLYEYTWTNITDTQAEGVTNAGSVFPGPPPLLLNQQGGLEGGKTYGVVAVETDLGCTSGQATVFLPNNFALPVIKTDSIASTNCVIEYPNPGDVISNGSAFVSLVDGKVPGAAGAVTGTDYSYNWTGTSVAPAPLVSGLTTVTISNIQGGYVYTVEVTNIATGCTNTDPVALPDKSVVPAISATVLQPNTICDAGLGTNGQLTTNFITPSGDPNEYEYSWRNITDVVGAGTTSLGSEFAGLLLNQQGGLNGGKTYGVIAVETALGCTSGEAQVFLPNNFTLPVVTIDSTASTNCVVEFPAPGTVISNGSIEITDVDGIPVGNPGAVTGTDYTYSWTDNVVAPAVSITGSAATQFTNVLEGGFQYTVQIRNEATGCTNTRAVALPKTPVKPTIAVTKTDDNINCDAGTFGSTGRLEAVVSYLGIAQNLPGGAPVLPANYVITWSTGSNGDILDLQPAANYTAFVVDEDLGCTSDPDGDIVLDDFEYPVITIDPATDIVDQTSCDPGDPNGAMSATITIAAGTLEYQWYEGIGTAGGTIGALETAEASGVVASITDEDSDDYTIFARSEATGCEAIRSALIPNNITYPAISLTNSQVVTVCRPTPNGESQVTLTDISALPGEDYDLFYVYTFTGGVAPTDPAIIKASTDPQNVSNGSGAPADYVDMAPGYLTALVVDNNTACESNPFTVEIIDNTVANQIAIDGVTNAALCGGVGGAIDVDVTGGVAPQTFSWYRGSPGNDPADGNINFFTNPPDMTAATQVLTDALAHHTGTVNGADEDLGLGSQPTLGVGAGTYTIVIEDNNGCGAYFVETVPFATAPVITVTTVDNSRCIGPFDGEVNVTVNGISPGGYQIEIYSGNSAAGNKLVDTGGTINTPGVNIPLSATLLEDGQYYVQVFDMDGINPTCPLGSIHTLKQLALEPLITIDNIVQNTSCDPGTGDGEVELTITPDSQHDLVNAFPDYQINTINPVPVGFAAIDPAENGLGVASSGTIGGFGPGGYIITVTDINSGCESDAAVNIPDQPVLPQIFTVTSLNDSYCAPASNGEILVTAVGPGLFTEYHFEWYADPNDIGVNPPDYEDDGDGSFTGGELFDLSKGAAAWTVGATNGQGNGNRTFYVRAARVLGNGVGCYTQVEQRTVLDLHKTPNLTLTTFDNTSCIPANGEGVIRAITDIENDPLDGNVINGTYTYSWAPDPGPGNTSPVAGIARITDFDITALTDATYTVTSINSVNGCSTSSTSVITTSPLPITLLSFTKQDQLICDPDGNIQVTEVEIDATNSVANTVFSFATAADLVANFDISWYDANNDADGNPSTFNNTLEIQSGGVDINDDILTEDGGLTAQPFAAMGEGTYYVIATRKPGLTPGAGCTTVPVRVDIIEDSNYPVITTLDAFANTSCDAGVVEGRIEITVQTTSGVGAESGSTYSYDWDPDNNTVGSIVAGADNVIIPPSYLAPPAALGLGDALVDDTYTITITNDYSGCTVSGQGVVTPTKYPITIISTTKENQLICNPDGSITVNQIDIDANNSGLGVFTFPGTGPLTPDFHYQWFNAADDGDGDATTFDDTQPLTDDASVGGNIIDSPTLTGDGSLTAGQYTPMAAGTYYVIATRDPTLSPGAGCSTEPVRVEILDQHINPVITNLDAFANTSCDAGVVEGRIELDVTTTSGVGAESGSTYTYDWTPVNGTVGTIAAGLSSVTIPPTYVAPPAILTLADALTDDTYTITITNDYSGCTVSGQGVVTPTKYPITIISTTKENQLICNPDGSITVNQIDIDGSSSGLPTFSFPGTGPLTEFNYQWFNAADDGDADGSTFDDTQALTDDASVGGNIIDSPVLTGDGSLTAGQYTPMAAGTYYVIATRDATLSPGAGCSTEPVRVEILDQHINPVITNLDAFANTSCDAGVVEGRIELAVNTTSTEPLESGSTYTYDWTPLNNTTGQILAGADNVTIPPTYLPPPAILTVNDALVEGTYTITVTNDYSGCEVTGQGIITPTKYPITIISTLKQDQLICNPDGSITVNQIDIDATNSNLGVFTFPGTGPLTEFTYQWFNAADDGDGDPSTFDDTTPLTDDASVGGDVIVTPVLTGDGSLTDGEYAPMAAGTYYVIATRDATLSPGAGCSTEPVRIEILDEHIDPVITNLDAFANTSCDAGVVEGRIEMTVETNGGVGPDGTSTYTYDWTPFNNTAGSIAAGAATVTIPPTYLPPPAALTLADALVDDTYTITVTNDYSGCTTTAQAVITPQKYPITLISFTKQDQLICDPDGRITVTQVTIDGSTSNLPSFNYIPASGNPLTDLANNFDLEWFNATNDGDTDANTFDNTIPIVDAGSLPITDVVLSEDAGVTTQPFPTMGAGSYYVLATRKPGMSPGAGCSTMPVRVNIEDLHINPVITNLDPFANTSCDAGVVEGRIELTVNTTSAEPLESGATYSYDWTPQNNTAGNFPNAGATVTLPPTYAAPPAVLGLGDAFVDDTYTITVTNDYSGCTTTAQAVITPQKYPITLISFTKQDQLVCDPDGRITVTQVTIDGSTSNLPSFNYIPASGDPLTDLANNFDLEWFNATNDGDNDANTYDDGVPIVDGTSAIITDVVLSEDAAETTQPFPTMGAGSYYVLATRKPGMSPGAGCSTLPVRVNIEDLHVNPVITALDAFANTSCDAGVVEGRVELTVNTTSAEPLESGSTYSYVWTPQNNTVGTFPNAGASVTLPPTYAAPPAALALGDAFVDDTYTITVTNDYSGCTTTAQAVITPTKYPITLISFDKQDQLICDPDGRITVTQVTIDGSTSNLPSYDYIQSADPLTNLADNFDFEWFNADNDGDNDANTYDDGTPILDGSNNPILDVVLSEDGAETTQPFLTMGAGSYYVLATRKPGMTPGAGCSTLPIRVNIEDLHINPVITSLEAFANTSCDAGIVEGRIELTVNTTSAEPLESGSTYTYDWAASNPGPANPFGVGTNPGAAATAVIPPGYQTPPTQPSDALKDDTYSITVTNDYSGCTTTAQAVITPQKYPITLISFTKQDQLICYPDGNITVTEVLIDGSAGNLPSYSFISSADPLTNLTDNFDFRWFEADNDGDGNTSTFDNSTPLTDAANATIIDAALSEDLAETTQPYTPMGAGTYYVLATRKAGMIPGAGCSTQPVRVDILDLHQDPEVTLTYEPNSSCDPVNPNGVIIATASEKDGSTVDTYSFTWEINGGPLTFGNPVNVDNHTGQLDNAEDGDYVVTLTNVSNTGCDIVASLNVTKDLNRSIPNIIDVATLDPADCNPSGMAEVTSISIGGVTFFNNPPDNLDVTFDYEWYRDDFAPANVIAGEVDHDLPNITAGTYFVLVEDLTTACKSTPKEVVLTDDNIVYPVVTIDQSQLQISCPASFGTGQLIALADGNDDSNPNYDFSWFNSLDGTGADIGDSNILSDLIAGDYSVTATDLTTNCATTELYIIQNEAEDFLPRLALSTEPRRNCLVPDGVMLAREVGYDATSDYPFAPNYFTEYYLGTNPDLTQSGIAMIEIPDPSQNWNAVGLEVGFYTVKITDNNTGCVVTDDIELIDERTPPIAEVVQTNPNINCYVDRPNGQLLATADGNRVVGYAFEWYTGATASGGVIQNNNVLFSSTMGTYTVRVTNNITGCFADGLGIITDGHVDPPVPTALVKQHQTNCDPGPYDGWVTANVNGVIVNYAFDWFDGQAPKATPDHEGHNYTELINGFYTVIAQDVQTGCFSPPATAEVLDETVIPVLTFRTTPSFCEDLPSDIRGGTGTAEVIISPEGMLSREIDWTFLADGSHAGSGNYIDGLFPGDYEVFVTTVQGCNATGQTLVETEVLAYNLVTQNGDTKNDLFVVDCISRFPNNNVKIYNRSGVLVYEANGYNNNDVVFKGLGEKGVYAAGNELPAGTYFYIIDKRNGTKPKTGYLELVK